MTLRGGQSVVTTTGRTTPLGGQSVAAAPRLRAPRVVGRREGRQTQVGRTRNGRRVRLELHPRRREGAVVPALRRVRGRRRPRRRQAPARQRPRRGDALGQGGLVGEAGVAHVAAGARRVGGGGGRRRQAVVAGHADGRQHVVVGGGVVRRVLGHDRGRRGAVLADNLLEGGPQHLPGEHFDVLLDVAWLRVAKAHDDLEEVLRVGLGLADGQGLVALQVAPDAVLLLDAEPVGRGDELLQQVDRVDRRDEAVLLLLPPDTADADAVGGPLVDGDGPEGRRQPAPRLLLFEHDDPAPVVPLLARPGRRHRLEVALELQRGLVVRRVVVVGAAEAHRWVPLRDRGGTN